MGEHPPPDLETYPPPGQTEIPSRGLGAHGGSVPGREHLYGYAYEAAN